MKIKKICIQDYICVLNFNTDKKLIWTENINGNRLWFYLFYAHWNVVQEDINKTYFKNTKYFWNIL